MYSVVVPGRPVPQGSMTPYAKGRMVGRRWEPFRTKDGRLVLGVKASNEKRLKAWRKRVTLVAAAAKGRPQTRLTGPLGVRLTFTFERPGTHYLQRVSGNVLRGDAPTWCDTVSTGDIDKLTRAAFDALTDAGWWVDDAQACALETTSRWGDADSLGIDVWRLQHEREPLEAAQLPLL